MTRLVERGAAWAVARRLARAIETSGARVGESAVASRFVHWLAGVAPLRVWILAQDAGQALYGRTRPGELLHLDVFHEPAALDPRGVARVVRSVLSCWPQAPHGTTPARWEDLFDVQTGAGGGRITGTLSGGRTPAVLRAHLHHVHLIGWVPRSELALALALVRGIESHLLACGVRPWRLEQLERLGPGEALPEEALRPYAAIDDSYLGAPPAERRQAGRAARGMGAPGAAPARGSATWPGPTALGEEPAPTGASGLPSSSEAEDRAAAAAGEARSPAAYARLSRAALAPWGQGLAGEPGGRRPGSRALATGGRRRIRDGSPPGSPPGCPPRGKDAVDVARTVRAAALRRAEAMRAAAGQGGRDRFRVAPRDVHWQSEPGRRGLRVCLLVDASASMAGTRLASARSLALHLVGRWRDRVALLTFQDRQAACLLSFTRSMRKLAEALAALRPGGLTPLAAGLEYASTFLAQNGPGGGRLRRTLLWVLTDGVPTAARDTGDPVRDALSAARALRQLGCRAAFIGLNPHAPLLQALAGEAGGQCHVFEEFTPENLREAARRERGGRRAQAAAPGS